MKKILIVAFIIVVLLLVTIFLTSSNPLNQQKVVVIMPFIPQIQWAAYYAALYNGYYKEEGLDIEIQYSTRGSAGPIEQL